MVYLMHDFTSGCLTDLVFHHSFSCANLTPCCPHTYHARDCSLLFLPTKLTPHFPQDSAQTSLPQGGLPERLSYIASIL